MTIGIGDSIPSIDFKYFSQGDMASGNTADMTSGKTTIIVGVPAAFSPTCSGPHIPGYVAAADQLKNKGVDQIICVSVNDPFAMQAWGEALGTADKVFMLPDGNATFTKDMGLDFDMSAIGAGTRSQRYGMIVRDGKITHLAIEENPGAATVSTVEALLEQL